MEGQLRDMIAANEAKKRNIPASLTQELEEHQSRE